MTLLRTISGIWKTKEETSERAVVPELRTRYYKENKDRLLDTIFAMLPTRLPGWKIVHVDRERGEIMAEKREFLGTNDIVVSVYPISAMQSAIEVVAARRGSIGDFGTTYRNIQEFFAALHKDIQPTTK